MIPDFENTSLLVIDVQEKLMSAMPTSDDLAKNIDILADLVIELGGNVFWTEQYPRGLGPTVEPLRERLKGHPRVEKTSFSCLGDGTFLEQILPQLGDDVIIVGIEAHVCVLQTVMDLAAESFADDPSRMIYVPIDAIASRRKLHWQNALDQLADVGVMLTNTETLVFQGLGDSTHEKFKHFSKRVR